MDTLLSMKQVRSRSGMSEHRLRYYERAGLLRNIGRLPNGRRVYRERDVEWLATLKVLRGTGMPIRRIRELAALVDDGDAAIAPRLRFFLAYREELREQLRLREQAIDTINRKIARHRRLLARSRREAQGDPA